MGNTLPLNICVRTKNAHLENDSGGKNQFQSAKFNEENEEIDWHEENSDQDKVAKISSHQIEGCNPGANSRREVCHLEGCGENMKLRIGHIPVEVAVSPPLPPP